MTIRDYVISRRREEGKNSVYEAICDYDELKGYWVRKSNYLGYPLRVQLNRKDGRLILNKDGWEEVLLDSAKEVSNIIGNDIYNFVRNDVYDEIKYETEYLLNSITYNDKNGFKAANKPREKKDFASKLGQMLGRALVKNMEKIWKDITGTGRR